MGKYGLEDRFMYDADGPSQADRDEAEMRIAKVEELRELLRNTLLTVGRELAGVSMLNKRDARLGSSDLEVIEGGAEEADALFDRLLDEVALKDAVDTRDYEP